MHDDEDEPEVRRRPSHARAVWLMLAPLLAVAALGVGFWRFDRHWRVEHEALIARLRAEGKLLLPADLWARTGNLLPNENSALAFLSAFQRMQDTTPGGIADSNTASLALGTEPSEASLQMAEKHLAANAEALALMHDAARLPVGCYPLGRTLSLDADTPHTRQVRKATGLLALAARVDGARGRPGDAAAALADMLALGRSLDGRLTMDEVMTRVIAAQECAAAAEQVLALCQLDRDALRGLGDGLLSQQRGMRLHDILVWERSKGNNDFGRMMHGEQVYDSSAASALYWRVPALQRRDACFFQSLLDPYEAVLAAPAPDRVQAAHQADAVLEQRVKAQQRRCPISALIAWDFGNVAQRSVEWEAELATAATALAVEEFRLEQGRWPESLGELVPGFLDAVPADPFTSGPLVYARTADGAVVYSVGDDGGRLMRDVMRTQRTWRSGEPADVGFRLLDPDRRGAARSTFRDEVGDGAEFVVRALREAGYSDQEMLDMGMTDTDLWFAGRLR